MSGESSPRPAFIKGLLWFTFSGTAMLSAFILPIHIWAIHAGYAMRLDAIWFRLYFVLLFGAMLYHSFYRVKTILFDLTFVKASKVLGGVLLLLFLGLMGLAVSLLF